MERFDLYLVLMRQAGTWGGDFEITAAAELFGYDIRLYSAAGKSNKKSRAAYTDVTAEANASKDQHLCLAYHNKIHY